ncbi:MAG: hypothetical protein WC862_04935 [Patescibacteria group bacterium]
MKKNADVKELEALQRQTTKTIGDLRKRLLALRKKIEIAKTKNAVAKTRRRIFLAKK